MASFNCLFKRELRAKNFYLKTTTCKQDNLQLKKTQTLKLLILLGV